MWGLRPNRASHRSTTSRPTRSPGQPALPATQPSPFPPKPSSYSLLPAIPPAQHGAASLPHPGLLCLPLTRRRRRRRRDEEPRLHCRQRYALLLQHPPGPPRTVPSFAPRWFLNVPWRCVGSWRLVCLCSARQGLPVQFHRPSRRAQVPEHPGTHDRFIFPVF